MRQAVKGRWSAEEVLVDMEVAKCKHSSQRVRTARPRKRQEATPDVDIPTINVGLVSKGSINVSESIYVSQQVLDVKE